MNAIRIDFQSADNARFNQLRDQWRSIAVSFDLNMSGLRLAGILPTYINREFGYAYPTDDDLAGQIGKSRETVKRGLNSLDEFRLIERITRPFRNEKGIVVGKQRRIYLTLPEVVETHVEPKGHIDQPKGHFSEEPKGHLPKGHAEPKGQDCTTEGTPGVANTLDSTPDYLSAYEREDLSKGTYSQNDPSVNSDPSAGTEVEEKKAAQQTDPSVVPAAPASSPTQEPNSYLAAKNDDEGLFVPSVPPVRWQDWKHPKILAGRPLSRKPFPAPRTIEAGEAFLLQQHVPALEWPRLMPNLMAGHLYEFDIEPWMDAA